MDIEAEAYELVRGHIAQDIKTAKEILIELEEKRRKSDIFIFYTDVQKVRGALKDNLIRESPYNYSQIRLAQIPSGKLKDISIIEDIALGKIMEFVPKSGDEARLGALIENFKFQGEEGVFLTDYSEEELLLRGTQPFEEKYPKSLYKIEFHPIRGDYVLGMFSTWNNHNICNHGSLVLWTHKNKVYVS